MSINRAHAVVKLSRCQGFSQSQQPPFKRPFTSSSPAPKPLLELRSAPVALPLPEPVTRPKYTAESFMKDIVPGSANHSCLRSFLQHAHATGLNQQSTHFLGTRYEYIVQRALQRLGFSLVRVGRGGDAGVDLLGQWTLPSPSPTSPGAAHTSTSGITPLAHTHSPVHAPLRVLLQCKRHTRRLVPEFVRELEGAFAGAPAAWRAPHSGVPTLGFLVSPQPASRGVCAALQRSRMPVGFIAVEEVGIAADEIAHAGYAHGGRASEEVEDGGTRLRGRITQMLWNWRAQQLGMQGVGVTLRHVDGGPASTPAATERGELALTWNGWAVPSGAAHANACLDALDANTSADASMNMDTSTAALSLDDTQPLSDGASSTIPTSSDSSTHAPEPRKKRGRPPKQQVDNANGDVLVSEISVVKKRGRPRKSKT